MAPRAADVHAALDVLRRGYTEVADIADRLVAEHPGWSTRQCHDALLAHGSPPPRHLAPLLGLRPAG